MSSISPLVGRGVGFNAGVFVFDVEIAACCWLFGLLVCGVLCFDIF
jgi:hypothetical protein